MTENLSLEIQSSEVSFQDNSFQKSREISSTGRNHVLECNKIRLLLPRHNNPSDISVPRKETLDFKWEVLGECTEKEPTFVVSVRNILDELLYQERTSRTETTISLSQMGFREKFLLFRIEEEGTETYSLYGIRLMDGATR